MGDPSSFFLPRTNCDSFHIMLNSLWGIYPFWKVLATHSARPPRWLPPPCETASAPCPMPRAMPAHACLPMPTAGGAACLPMPSALIVDWDRQMKAHSEAMAAQVKNSASVGEASFAVQTPVERQGLSRQQARWCSLSLCGDYHHLVDRSR